MTHQGIASRLGKYPFEQMRLALSSIALVMATGCLSADTKPKNAGGNAGQAGIAGWQNGTTMGNGQESAIGGTRGSSNDTRAHGGATSTGGTTATTANIGGANQGGAATNKDATEVVGGVGTSSGTSSSGIGGAANMGGTSAAAGALVKGGTRATGGAAPTGGSGGAVTGSSTGGQTSATGGASSTSGGTTCPMPSTFRWTSGGPIAGPASGWDSIKHFTHVPHDGNHLIYMTMQQGAYGAAMMSFADWSDATTATQSKLSFAAVAPTLFYFTPKQTWVLAYQWGATGFSYRTSSDPTNPNGWSSEQSLYGSKDVPAGTSETGVIDQQVICDAEKCYLYFNGGNGYIYRSSMAIGSFPGEFPRATTVMQDTDQRIFEAVQVYTIKGSNKYLLINEAQSSNGRYFRAWTAADLGGTWSLLTDNFASKSNTLFSENWTNDISHGDLVRAGADETFPIDPCNLQMVYQSRDPRAQPVESDIFLYKLGLLTAAKY